MTNPTDPDNERFDWGPYTRNEDGWATDTQAEDGKLGLGVLLDRAEQQTTIKDAEANIDDYRPLAGRTFEATDVEREYVGDGSSWVQRATRGPNPTFDSATVDGPTETKGLSVTSPDGDLTTEVVDVITDTDASTTLDLDTGTLSTAHDKYDIDLAVANKSGGTDDDLRMQFNGVTTADYNTVEMVGATLNQKTGLSHLAVGGLQRYNYSVYEVTVRKEIEPASSGAKKLRCWGNGRGSPDYAVIQNGELVGLDGEDLTQIRAFSGLAATGRMVVTGAKITSASPP